MGIRPSRLFAFTFGNITSHLIWGHRDVQTSCPTGQQHSTLDEFRLGDVRYVFVVNYGA